MKRTRTPAPPGGGQIGRALPVIPRGTEAVPLGPTGRQLSEAFRAWRAGSDTQICADFCGVTLETFQGWIVQGRIDAAEGIRSTCRDLVEGLKLERSSRAITLLERINDAALAGDTRAAQWLLERTHPQTFGAAAIEAAAAAPPEIGGDYSDESLEELIVDLVAEAPGLEDTDAT